MLQDLRYTVAYAILVLLSLDEFAWGRSMEGGLAGVAVGGAVALTAPAAAIVGRFLYRKVTLNGDIYRVWYGTNWQTSDFGLDCYLNTLGTSTCLASGRCTSDSSLSTFA